MLNLTKHSPASEIEPQKIAHDANPATMTLGRLIKTKREERGLTQRKLAAILGHWPGTIAHWELDHATPSTKSMRLIQSELGIEPGRLLVAGRPYAGELVESPNELALLHFWRSLDDMQRRRVIDLLMTPGAAVRASPALEGNGHHVLNPPPP